MANMWKNCLDHLIQAMNAVGTCLIVVLALLINADVVGRGAFNYPLPGVPEFAGMVLVAIVFLQIPCCLQNDQVMRTDAFLGRLFMRVPATAAALNAFYNLVGAGIFIVIAHAGWRLTAKAWTGDEYEGIHGVLTLPTWPVKGAIVAGASLMALLYIGIAWRNLHAIKTGQYAGLGAFTEKGQA